MNYKDTSFKILIISFLGILIFYCLVELFTSTPEVVPIPIPKDWQKMELTLMSNYFATPGETISLLHTDGSILIPKALLLTMEKKAPPWSEQNKDNFIKVLIATPKLTLFQWQEVHSKNPEQIYLSPFLANAEYERPNKSRRRNYELYY